MLYNIYKCAWICILKYIYTLTYRIDTYAQLKFWHNHCSTHPYFDILCLRHKNKFRSSNYNTIKFRKLQKNFNKSNYSGNLIVRRESSSLISKSAVEPSLKVNDKPPSITRQASNILDFTSILQIEKIQIYISLKNFQSDVIMKS